MNHEPADDEIAVTRIVKLWFVGFGVAIFVVFLIVLFFTFLGYES